MKNLVVVSLVILPIVLVVGYYVWKFRYAKAPMSDISDSMLLLERYGRDGSYMEFEEIASAVKLRFAPYTSHAQRGVRLDLRNFPFESEVVSSVLELLDNEGLKAEINKDASGVPEVGVDFWGTFSQAGAVSLN